MNGQTAWPVLLADLEAKRDALNVVIDTVKKHFVPVNGTMPASVPLDEPRRTYTRRAAVKTKKAAKRNERTNERTNERSKARANGASLT